LIKRGAEKISVPLLIYLIILFGAVCLASFFLIYMTHYIKKKYFVEKKENEEQAFSLGELSEMKKRKIITTREHRILKKNVLTKVFRKSERPSDKAKGKKPGA